MSLSDLQIEIHREAVKHGWWDPTDPTERNFGELIALCHSELSEALEAWREGDTVFYLGDEGKPEGWGIELADALIRILDICQALGVNAEEMIRFKMHFNEGRPYRHGGKAI